MPNAITTETGLKQRIAELELMRKQQQKGIKGNVQEIAYSLRPANLVKLALINISETPVLRQNLMNALVSLGTGWVASKLAVRHNDTLVKKAVSSAVQYGVSHLMATRRDAFDELFYHLKKNFKPK